MRCVTRLIALAMASCASADSPAPRPFTTFAFYYGWYGTPEVSGRWVHWADAGHDPTKLDVQGLPDIAALRHPAEGLYDSNDDAVIRRHLDLAEAAGIDVLIATWWGFGSFEDQSFKKLTDVIERDQRRIRVVIYYERFPEDRIENGVAEIERIVSEYGARPSYYKQDGKPVIFFYGRVIFPPFFCFAENCPADQPVEVDWAPYMERLRDSAFLTGDALGLSPVTKRVHRVIANGFAGVHIYNPSAEMSYLQSNLDKHLSGYVQEVKASGRLPAVTIVPGYNDTQIGRPYAFDLDRRGGELYREMWKAAKASGAPWILITSFNEWHEGTEIEPSAELGDLYLRITKAETNG